MGLMGPARRLCGFIGMAALMAAAFTARTGYAQTPDPAAKQSAAVRHVTQGRAKTVIDNLFRCTVKVSNHRISAVGTITATDGTVLTVPAETVFQKGPKGADLFNECNKVVPQADRGSLRRQRAHRRDRPRRRGRHRLHRGGQLLRALRQREAGRRGRRTVHAVQLDHREVQGEEAVHLRGQAGRLGGESRPRHRVRHDRRPVSPGRRRLHRALQRRHGHRQLVEGAVVLHRAADEPRRRGRRKRACTTRRAGSGASIRMRPSRRARTAATPCTTRFPTNWAAPSFDDSKWPHAFEYTDADVGVTNLRAYTLFPELFAGARWIWSFNLVLRQPRPRAQDRALTYRVPRAAPDALGLGVALAKYLDGLHRVPGELDLLRAAQLLADEPQASPRRPRSRRRRAPSGRTPGRRPAAYRP